MHQCVNRFVRNIRNDLSRNREIDVNVKGRVMLVISGVVQVDTMKTMFIYSEE